MKTQEEIILKIARDQEQFLLRLRETLEKRLIKAADNKTFQHESAKLEGMINVMDALKIDRTEFNWIFNA